MSAVAHIRPQEALLTKQQLAAHLKRSPRWVEIRVRDGMPSEPPTKRYPQRRFRLSAVEGWLADSERRPQPADRVSQLEERVDKLAATVERLMEMMG